MNEYFKLEDRLVKKKRFLYTIFSRLWTAYR